MAGAFGMGWSNDLTDFRAKRARLAQEIAMQNWHEQINYRIAIDDGMAGDVEIEWETYDGGYESTFLNREEATRLRDWLIRFLPTGGAGND